VQVLSIVHESEAGSGVFANAARERGAHLAEWIPAQRPAPAADGFDAVLVFGGAMNVNQEREHRWLRSEKELLHDLLDRATPTLGVCLGAQLLAEVAHGAVTRMPVPEIGWLQLELAHEARTDPLLGVLPRRFDGFQWHSCEIVPPDDAVVLARSTACLQAYRLRRVPWWGIQFHAEATSDTIAAWVDDYRSDEDAVRAELDWDALLGETARRIAGWNELGAGICARFLECAADIVGG
jgi:GMP synthase-like glutamine amidotransferase